jgi:hypothetical protein
MQPICFRVRHVAKVRAEARVDVVVSNYVMTHYDTLIALKAAIEKAGKVDKAAIADALAGLTIASPTGPVTIDHDHYATMNMFIAKTWGRDLVTVRALGAFHVLRSPQVTDITAAIAVANLEGASAPYSGRQIARGACQTSVEGKERTTFARAERFSVYL